MASRQEKPSGQDGFLGSLSHPILDLQFPRVAAGFLRAFPVKLNMQLHTSDRIRREDRHAKNVRVVRVARSPHA